MWRRYPQGLDAGEPDGDPLGAPMLWPDGRHIAANGLGRIFLWSLATGECTRVLKTGAIFRDGEPSFRLAGEAALGRVLEAHKIRGLAVWDSKDWRRVQTFEGHGEEVQAAAFVSEDRVVSISGDSSARLWEARTGENLRTLETGPLYALAHAPARGLVAVGGSNGAVHLLEGLTLNVRALFHLRMATARHEPLGAERKKQIGIVWNRPSNTLRALAWHPDGEHLLCGSWDFVARMFHSRTGRVVRQWQGHAHWVNSVAVEPARRLLCTGSSDGTVRVWSLDSTECLAVHDVGHANLGGLLVHDRTLYVTCQRELLSMPLD
ncbi:WD40 repeat domain-containing protein [Stigmatella aurantiaca]|uniref:WD-repeat protein n=2 Tax=Stigmatella aurantiaca (strain DW4/3-1) TaxID=378806 RepID=E3FF14_STIAD|nr:transcriptional regulator [Stigmatella aurantiaca]ADO70195.1 WD-repeat protein [Stigmatella aurantiaca DW4/3-1]